MEVTWYNEKDNTLYILTSAIKPKGLSMKKGIEYMNKPYKERIAESPYREEIEKELLKHPNCKISEYMNA